MTIIGSHKSVIKHNPRYIGGSGGKDIGGSGGKGLKGDLSTSELKAIGLFGYKGKPI